jgi:hypothetical protein
MPETTTSSVDTTATKGCIWSYVRDQYEAGTPRVHLSPRKVRYDLNAVREFAAKRIEGVNGNWGDE